MYVSLGQEGPPAAPRVGRVSSGGLCEFHHQWSGGREQQPAYRTVPYFASAVSYYLLQTSAFPFLLLQTSLLDWYLRGVLLLPVLGGRWGKTRRLGGSPSAGSSRQPGKASRRGGCKGSHNRWNKPQERPLSYSKFCCFFLLVVVGGGGGGGGAHQCRPFLLPCPALFRLVELAVVVVAGLCHGQNFRANRMVLVRRYKWTL